MAEEPLNFQIPPTGFDSYLVGVLPDDQAVLAGAFATAMMQIKNIQKINLKDFAQVAYNNETTFGLPAVGTGDIPTDLQLAQVAQTLTALGSGVYGTYTMSNFFGCMSGLPYPLRDIYNGIKELETDTLKKIYQNLYLAVQWEQAVVTVEYTTNPGPPPTYTIDKLVLTTKGGGYLREGASPPTITINGGSGATATLTLGTNPSAVGSNGGGSYGRVTNVILTSAGSSSTTIPTATITAPPGPDPAVDNTGYNALIQLYIDAANAEIEAIENASPSNFTKAQVLDTNWNISGIALKHEQRARFIAIPPVPVPWDRWLTTYPVALYTFTDSIPMFAQNTLPHMSAQTLEHISDLDLAGGQSMIAMMRQERNAARMSLIGVGLDNNLADSLVPEQQIQLMTDGVLPGAVEGINGYTLPAWPEDSLPLTVYDQDLPGLVYIEELDEGDVSPLLEVTLEDIPTPDTPAIDFKEPKAPLLIVNPLVPISLGGPVQEPDYPLQPTIPILPPTLQTNATGTTLYPAGYNIPEAIDKVVECNCDCWVY